MGLPLELADAVFLQAMVDKEAVAIDLKTLNKCNLSSNGLSRPIMKWMVICVSEE